MGDRCPHCHAEMLNYCGVTKWSDSPTTAKGEVGAHQTFTCGLKLVLDVDLSHAALWWKETAPCTGIGWRRPYITETLDATIYHHPTQGEITYWWQGPSWSYRQTHYDTWEKAVRAAANWKEPEFGWFRRLLNRVF